MNIIKKYTYNGKCVQKDFVVWLVLCYRVISSLLDSVSKWNCTRFYEHILKEHIFIRKYWKKNIDKFLYKKKIPISVDHVRFEQIWKLFYWFHTAILIFYINL